MPASLEFGHMRLGRFVRREVHPNGGGEVLHLYWDEICHLEPSDMMRLAKDFLKETFYEDPPGVARYVMGIVHGAAHGMPDFVDYFAEHHPNLGGQVRCVGSPFGHRDYLHGQVSGNGWTDIQQRHVPSWPPAPDEPGRHSA
ncbi:hypothetical protein MTO96_027139 [Rhipicephalus appendiculatus]